MAGECVVCKTDFGFEEWSLNEMFLDWGNQVNEARLGLYDDILDDREDGCIYYMSSGQASGTPFPLTRGGSRYRLLWTVAG
jgi:hypothetical protein